MNKKSQTRDEHKWLAMGIITISLILALAPKMKSLGETQEGVIETVQTIEVVSSPAIVPTNAAIITTESSIEVDTNQFDDLNNRNEVEAEVYEDSDAKKYDDKQERIRKKKELKRQRKLEKQRKERERKKRKRLAKRKFERSIISDFKFSPSNVTKLSGLNKKTLKIMLKKTHLRGFEELFLKMEKKHNVNVMFAVGNAINESGWHGSHKSRYHNNLFGISLPGFTTKESCIKYYFDLIDDHYVGEGRLSSSSIQKKYCPTNPRWDEEITSIVGTLRSKIN